MCLGSNVPLEMFTRGSNPTIKDSTTRVLYSISSLDARRVDGTGSPLFFSTWASFRRFYFDVARRSRRLRPERPASVDRCCNRIRYRYVVKLVTVYPASLLRLRIARFVGHETEAKTPLCIYDPIKRTVRRNIYIFPRSTRTSRNSLAGFYRDSCDCSTFRECSILATGLTFRRGRTLDD